MVMPREDCQPRYHAYCVYNGVLTKDEMWARDGNGANFMNWIRESWSEWEKTTGHNGKYHSEQDHVEFDKWLFEKAKDAKK